MIPQICLHINVLLLNILLRFCCCFFFQAEDGIRDLVRSRGLGDVYKRQVQEFRIGELPVVNAQGELMGHVALKDLVSMHFMSVSYTHLTLPTSDLV